MVGSGCRCYYPLQVSVPAAGVDPMERGDREVEMPDEKPAQPPADEQPMQPPDGPPTEFRGQSPGPVRFPAPEVGPPGPSQPSTPPASGDALESSSSEGGSSGSDGET